jgi:hypothetical protein
MSNIFYKQECGCFCAPAVLPPPTPTPQRKQQISIPASLPFKTQYGFAYQSDVMKSDVTCLLQGVWRRPPSHRDINNASGLKLNVVQDLSLYRKSQRITFFLKTPSPPSPQQVGTHFRVGAHRTPQFRQEQIE